MSDTISGLNSSYLNGTYTNSTTSALESTLNNKDLSTSSSDELMEVCKDFEEYFAEQMVKSMLKMAKVDMITAMLLFLDCLLTAVIPE